MTEQEKNLPVKRGRKHLYTGLACSVDGCGSDASVKGLCKRHYSRRWSLESRSPSTNKTVSTVCSCGDHAFKPLTKGFVALVSTQDVALLDAHSWWASIGKNTVYVRRSLGRTTTSLHRGIINPAPDNVVDHKDGNGLDNRRENIREATKPQNSINRLNRVVPKSGFYGVAPNRKRWSACIHKESGLIYLGLFKTPEEAARVRDAAAIQEYGEFAVLNFPTEAASNAR